MAKKTLKIADKPTLDELKALLQNSGYGLEALKTAIGDSTDKDAPEIKVIRTTLSANTLSTPLNINGRGKLLGCYLFSSLYKSTSIPTNETYPLNLKVTVDGDIIFYKKCYYNNTSGTAAVYGSLGIVTKSYTGDTIPFIIPSSTRGLVSCSSYVDGGYVSNQSGALIVKAYDGPIKFNSSLKIDCASANSPTFVGLYTLDNNY